RYPDEVKEALESVLPARPLEFQLGGQRLSLRHCWLYFRAYRGPSPKGLPHRSEPYGKPQTPGGRVTQKNNCHGHRLGGVRTLFFPSFWEFSAFFLDHDFRWPVPAFVADGL